MYAVYRQLSPTLQIHEQPRCSTLIRDKLRESVEYPIYPLIRGIYHWKPTHKNRNSLDGGGE